MDGIRYLDGFQTTKKGGLLHLAASSVFFHVFFLIATLGMDGQYWSLGNVPFKDKRLEDIHVWVLSPPNVSVVDFMKETLVPQIQELQKGRLLTKEEQQRLPGKYGKHDENLVFVIVGVGVG